MRPKISNCCQPPCDKWCFSERTNGRGIGRTKANRPPGWWNQLNKAAPPLSLISPRSGEIGFLIYSLSLPLSLSLSPSQTLARLSCHNLVRADMKPAKRHLFKNLQKKSPHNTTSA